MNDIPFVHKYGKYWHCDCNKILHDVNEVLKHTHKHALNKMETL